MNESYFKYHLFFCTNQRDNGQDCCQNHHASTSLGYAKDRIKQMDLNKPGQVRISRSGCLGRCDDGPVLVIYPDAVWYSCVDEADIDEIIDKHIVNGIIVDRLRLD